MKKYGDIIGFIIAAILFFAAACLNLFSDDIAMCIVWFCFGTITILRVPTKLKKKNTDEEK